MIAQYAQRAMRIGTLAAAAGLAACTAMLLPPNVAPVIAPSTSVEDAARRLKEAATDRAAIEATYAASEQRCYARFFVNNCLDEAREKRRSALAVVRAVEVDAEHFTRKAAVEQRDREVESAVKEFEEAEARAAAAPPAPPRAPAVPKPAPAVPKASVEERKAAQEARLARRAEQEKADAPKRAANAAAFEKRRLESLERQREVEAKKAEKAAKAAKEAAPAK